MTNDEILMTNFWDYAQSKLKLLQVIESNGLGG